MAKSQKRKGPPSTVFLVMYSADNSVVKRVELSYEDYYEELHPEIDSNEFRVQHGIRRMTGEIFDYKGQLQQSFETTFDAAGAYAHGRAEFSDGTVVQD